MDRETILSIEPNILVSIINMKLRDFYSSLSILCKDIGIKEKEIEDKLEGIGYKYDEDKNQFKII